MSKSATQSVVEYLEAMEARDLTRAAALLSPDFRMTFPGGIELASLESLIEWSKPRYQFVRKTFERFEALDVQSGSNGVQQVVYCFGTLAGAWNDGRPFSGIRFIDRFIVSNGKLADQRVWNDMAEAVVNAARTPGT